MQKVRQVLFKDKYIAEFNLALFLLFCMISFYGFISLIADWLIIFQYYFG